MRVFFVRLFLLLPTLLSVPAVSFASENIRELPTELKLSSVGVSIRAPLGFRYRPGELFPLEFQISNPGAAMDVEIQAIEGGGKGNEWAERGRVPSPVTLANGTSRFQLPMRAPGVSAAIELVIRGGASGSGKAELYRANLSRVLQPLPSGGRVVVFCGGGLAKEWAQDQAARLAPNELLADDWMWESVDWLVLNDASIASAPSEALGAMRRWLIGGGRVFLRSSDALGAALKLRLLPFEATGDIPSALKWWQKNAGLKDEDVLASKNFRPVYARLRNGFGQIVFLFPGSQLGDADEAAVFNRPDVQRLRQALPDSRVQPGRFAAFVPSSPGESQRHAVMLWSMIEALIVCVALFFARTSRSKIETALVPLGAGALLVALLANGFQQHELTVSRVISERISGDGSTVVRDEWAFLEAFLREKSQLDVAVEVSATGPQAGIFAPRFEESGDLRIARVDRVMRGRNTALEKITIRPNQPVLLFSNTIQARNALTLSARSELVKIDASISLTVNPDDLRGMDRRRAVWICANKSVVLLQKNTTSDGYSSSAFDDRALEVLLSEETDSSLAKAHGLALKWAMSEAVKNNGEALVFWSTAPVSNSGSIVIEGVVSHAGSDFLMRTIGVEKVSASK